MNKKILLLIIGITNLNFLNSEICLAFNKDCYKELEKICPSDEYPTSQDRQECKQANIFAFSFECMLTDKERQIKQKRYDFISKRKENIRKQRVEELKKIKQNSKIVDFSNVDLENQEEVDNIAGQTLKNSRKSHNSNGENNNVNYTTNSTIDIYDSISNSKIVKKKNKRKYRERKNTTNIFTANNNLTNEGLYGNEHFNYNNYIYTPFGIISKTNNIAIAKVDYTGKIKPTNNMQDKIEYYQKINSQCQDDINSLCDNGTSLKTATKSQRYISKCIRTLKKNKDYLSLKCQKTLSTKNKTKNNNINNIYLHTTKKYNPKLNPKDTITDNDNIISGQEIETYNERQQTEDEELKELEMYLFDDYDEFKRRDDDDGMDITMPSGLMVKESQINRLIDKYKDKYESMNETGQIEFINKYFDRKQ